jgi:uncharacterized protein YprB with RNaseH-like and TPR domain
VPQAEGLRARLAEITRARRPGEARADECAERAIGEAALAIGEGARANGDLARAPVKSRRRTKPERSGAPIGAQAHLGVEAYLPGGEWRDESGAVFVHERLRSEIEKPRGHWGRLGVPPEHELDLTALVGCGLERALFLDLETGGLSSSPVFLAGTMHWNGEDFVIRQYFARHYGEERSLLRAVSECARGFEFLVTFNGKSYDAPFLATRALIHGVNLSLPPRHLDLLHASRRRWKRELTDCRLQTLEYHVCRRRRFGDVPSDEVPGLYHDFVRSGDPWRLIPVFHHNLLDVITMAEIVRTLCDPGRPPVDALQSED